MLIIFGGLPGCGKTTIAKALARRLNATYLRIDSFEQGIRDAFIHNPNNMQRVVAEGYMAAYAVAKDNLMLELTVIADSVNPIEITRSAWRDVANASNKPFIEVELSCSDKIEHQSRIESRQPDIEGLKQPTWQDVLDRDYEPWLTPTLSIDTAKVTVADAVNRIVELLKFFF